MVLSPKACKVEWTVCYNLFLGLGFREIRSKSALHGAAHVEILMHTCIQISVKKHITYKYIHIYICMNSHFIGSEAQSKAQQKITTYWKYDTNHCHSHWVVTCTMTIKMATTVNLKSYSHYLCAMSPAWITF